MNSVLKSATEVVQQLRCRIGFLLNSQKRFKAMASSTCEFHSCFGICDTASKTLTRRAKDFPIRWAVTLPNNLGEERKTYARQRICTHAWHGFFSWALKPPSAYVRVKKSNQKLFELELLKLGRRMFKLSVVMLFYVVCWEGHGLRETMLRPSQGDPCYKEVEGGHTSQW